MNQALKKAKVSCSRRIPDYTGTRTALRSESRIQEAGVHVLGRIPGRLGRSPGTSVFKAIRNRVTLQQWWSSSCPSLRFWVSLSYRSKLPQKFYWWFFQTVPGKD